MGEKVEPPAQDLALMAKGFLGAVGEHMDVIASDRAIEAAVFEFAQKNDLSVTEVWRWRGYGLITVSVYKYVGSNTYEVMVRLQEGMTINEARQAAKVLDRSGTTMPRFYR